MSIYPFKGRRSTLIQPNHGQIMTHRLSSNAAKSIFTHVALVVFCTAALIACSNIGARTRSFFGGQVRMDVTVEPNANRNSPVAMDLLIVYDEALLSQLLKLTAKEWFAQRDQIKKDHLEDSGLDTWEWEWVPGQLVPLIELPLKPNAEGALIFVDYLASGAHRFRVDPFEDQMIHFHEDHVTIEPMN